MYWLRDMKSYPTSFAWSLHHEIVYPCLFSSSSTIFQNISSNKLGSKGAKYVCEMIQENSTLRVLNVAKNEFKDSDAQYFEEAMRMNFKLKVTTHKQ